MDTHYAGVVDEDVNFGREGDEGAGCGADGGL